MRMLLACESADCNMYTHMHNAGGCGARLGSTHFAFTKKCRSKHHCQVFCRHLVAVSVGRNACEEREQLSNNAHVRFRHVFQHVSTLYDFGFTFRKAGASSGRISKKTECECKRADSTYKSGRECASHGQSLG